MLNGEDYCFVVYFFNTVDGRNPAPTEMYKAL